MNIVIEIPDSEVPSNQELLWVGLHFIDGHVCECTYPFEEFIAPNEVLDKTRAEIDEQYDRVHPYNISCAEGLEMALNIIDKYRESIGAGEE